LQNVLNSYDLNNGEGYCRNYIAEHGTQLGLDLYLEFEIVNDSSIYAFSLEDADQSSKDRAESRWNEAAGKLNRLARNNPEILFSLPNINASGTGESIQNSSKKSLSKHILSAIESLVQKKPSSEPLWNQWLFWRGVEGEGRSVEPLMDSIKPSPLAGTETVLPGAVLEAYYNECVKNESWSKLISLLQGIWDREFERIVESKKLNEDGVASNSTTYTSTGPGMFVRRDVNYLGDNVGIALIRAYLMENKFREASDIFDAWMNSGGKFTNAATIIELARARGSDRLAREWEEKVGK
jgi:hypothetical protein